MVTTAFSEWQWNKLTRENIFVFLIQTIQVLPSGVIFFAFILIIHQSEREAYK